MIATCLFEIVEGSIPPVTKLPVGFDSSPSRVRIGARARQFLLTVYPFAVRPGQQGWRVGSNHAAEFNDAVQHWRYK